LTPFSAAFRPLFRLDSAGQPGIRFETPQEGRSLLGWRSGVSGFMGTKPANDSRVKLLTSSIYGTAMTSIWHLPQNYFSRVVGANPFGLLGRNVVICQPVY
jgi:hypothetical protein